MQYVASELERFWVRSISQLAEENGDWRRGCAAMCSAHKQVLKWLAAAGLRQRRINVRRWPSDVFSYHSRSRAPARKWAGCPSSLWSACSVTRSTIATRGCPSRVTKATSCPSLRASLRQPVQQRQGWHTSLQWFVTHYARLGLAFDRIFAWEATPHLDSQILREMPPAVHAPA